MKEPSLTFFLFFTEAEKGHPYGRVCFCFRWGALGELPGIQRLLRDFKNVKGCIIETETYLPAILYNKGAELASGDWVVFLRSCRVLVCGDV